LKYCQALPNGRSLRPEEHWRPAAARDISKFTPRHALVNAKSSPAENEFVQLARAIKQSNKSKSTHKASNVDLAAECGIEGPPSKDRIVGGFEAQENEWPWQVALFIDNAWFCGGALISENYVMTAAHCADGASYFDIMAGAHNVRASSEPHRVEITSYNGWTHPQWDSNTLSNDIALIELPSPIAFNDYIRPSCMPMAGDTADVNEMVTCTGWGKPSDSAGGISPVLRMVEDRPIISNRECNDIYGIVGDGVVCIDTTGGKGTCNGDSGGPLNMKYNVKGAGDKWKQVGVVSFGASAGCEVGYPAGFTRTESYLDWVCSETNGVGC
jgi:secreted trypsin-like serine protease